MSLWRHFNDLLVLRIGLDLAAYPAQVSIHLESGDGGERNELASWSFSPDEFGLKDQFTRQEFRGDGVRFALPKDWASELASILQSLDGDPSRKQALWLFLEKPYGYLGLIPWERLLHDEVELPLVRVPGFYSGEPAEYSGTLDVAICSSVPVAKGEFDSADYVRRVASAYSTIGREIRLHVFVDTPTYRQLTSDPIQGEANVILYDPSDSIQFGSPRRSKRISSSAEVGNPWLRWISAAVPNRALDAVHFINHGYFSGDVGAVAFAQSPTKNNDYGWARFISTAQLSTFLTQAGAWCALFTSPPNNYSVIGLRYLADDLAHQHPGPVAFHDISEDSECTALKSACQYLFDPQRAVPANRSRDLFLYASPRAELLRQESMEDRILQHAMVRKVDPTSALESATSSLGDLLSDSPEAPKWLAVSERYLAKYRAASTTSLPSDLLSMSADEPESVSDQTLRTIQKTIEEYARTQSEERGNSASDLNP